MLSVGDVKLSEKKKLSVRVYIYSTWSTKKYIEDKEIQKKRSVKKRSILSNSV